MKQRNKFIRAMINAISKVGVYLDLGCPIDKVLMYKEKAYNLAPNKYVCVVSGWNWIDIDKKEVLKSPLIQFMEQVQPSFLVAEYVIEDDSGRFSEGSYIRTSFLVTFHESCFFETQNTIYVLVGSGTRSTVSLKKAEDLFGEKGIFTS